MFLLKLSKFVTSTDFRISPSQLHPSREAKVIRPRFVWKKKSAAAQTSQKHSRKNLSKITITAVECWIHKDLFTILCLIRYNFISPVLSVQSSSVALFGSRSPIWVTSYSANTPALILSRMSSRDWIPAAFGQDAKTTGRTDQRNAQAEAGTPRGESKNTTAAQNDCASDLRCLPNVYCGLCFP